MNLIKKVVGGIFGFIGGLLGGLLKLVGIGKGEYYMELDNTSAPTSPEATASAPANLESSKETPAARKVGAPSAPASPSVSPSAPMKPLVEPNLPAASQAPETKEAVAPTVKNFATDFLISAKTRGSRRRPGPSLSPFKDMAKQLGSKGASMV